MSGIYSHDYRKKVALKAKEILAYLTAHPEGTSESELGGIFKGGTGAALMLLQKHKLARFKVRAYVDERGYKRQPHYWTAWDAAGTTYIYAKSSHIGCFYATNGQNKANARFIATARTIGPRGIECLMIAVESMWPYAIIRDEDQQTLTRIIKTFYGETK